jgi:hypothetical protein
MTRSRTVQNGYQGNGNINVKHVCKLDPFSARMLISGGRQRLTRGEWGLPLPRLRETAGGISCSSRTYAVDLKSLTNGQLAQGIEYEADDVEGDAL